MHFSVEKAIESYENCFVLFTLWYNQRNEVNFHFEKTLKMKWKDLPNNLTLKEIITIENEGYVGHTTASENL